MDRLYCNDIIIHVSYAQCHDNVNLHDIWSAKLPVIIVVYVCKWLCPYTNFHGEVICDKSIYTPDSVYHINSVLYIAERRQGSAPIWRTQNKHAFMSEEPCHTIRIFNHLTSSLRHIGLAVNKCKHKILVYVISLE